MVDTIKLYISAAKDLSAERDFLNRSITELPVTLGWQILLSPIKEKQINKVAIREADIHLLILGEDIRAPIGFEWYLSRQAQRSPIPFMKKGILRTPAAQAFQRDISYQTNWLPYNDLSDLRFKALQQISSYILSQDAYFTLNSSEKEELSNFIMELEDHKPELIKDTLGGAGENSVILSRERFTPKDGVLIKAPSDNDQNNI